MYTQKCNSKCMPISLCLYIRVENIKMSVLVFPSFTLYTGLIYLKCTSGCGSLHVYIKCRTVGCKYVAHFISMICLGIEIWWYHKKKFQDNCWSEYATFNM